MKVLALSNAGIILYYKSVKSSFRLKNNIAVLLANRHFLINRYTTDEFLQRWSDGEFNAIRNGSKDALIDIMPYFDERTTTINGRIINYLHVDSKELEEAFQPVLRVKEDGTPFLVLPKLLEQCAYLYQYAVADGQCITGKPEDMERYGIHYAHDLNQFKEDTYNRHMQYAGENGDYMPIMHVMEDEKNNLFAMSIKIHWRILPLYYTPCDKCGSRKATFTESTVMYSRGDQVDEQFVPLFVINPNTYDTNSFTPDEMRDLISVEYTCYGVDEINGDDDEDDEDYNYSVCSIRKFTECTILYNGNDMIHFNGYNGNTCSANDVLDINYDDALPFCHCFKSYENLENDERGIRNNAMAVEFWAEKGIQPKTGSDAVTKRKIEKHVCEFERNTFNTQTNSVVSDSGSHIAICVRNSHYNGLTGCIVEGLDAENPESNIIVIFQGMIMSWNKWMKVMNDDVFDSSYMYSQKQWTLIHIYTIFIDVILRMYHYITPKFISIMSDSVRSLPKREHMYHTELEMCLGELEKFKTKCPIITRKLKEKPKPEEKKPTYETTTEFLTGEKLLEMIKNVSYIYSTYFIRLTTQVLNLKYDPTKVVINKSKSKTHDKNEVVEEERKSCQFRMIHVDDYFRMSQF